MLTTASRKTLAVRSRQRSFEARVSVLRRFFDELLAQVQHDGLYGDAPISEAFNRQYREPGRGNLEEWTQQHHQRTREH